jgi:hypothetical protein
MTRIEQRGALVDPIRQYERLASGLSRLTNTSPHWPIGISYTRIDPTTYWDSLLRMALIVVLEDIVLIQFTESEDIPG